MSMSRNAYRNVHSKMGGDSTPLANELTMTRVGNKFSVSPPQENVASTRRFAAAA